MKIGRLRLVFAMIVFIAILLAGASEAHAGVTKIQVRPFVGLFGGSNALDGISGYTISPFDVAIGHDGSGVTWYAFGPQDAGVTTESTSPPYRVCPDDQQAGGTGSGTTTWAQMAISGNTVYGKVFVVDTRPLRGADVDAWNAVQSQVSAFVAEQLRAYLAAAAFSGETKFALDSKLDAAGAPGTTSATSMYALPATKAELTAYTSTSPWATSAELTAQTATSPWATVNLANISGQTVFAGTSAFVINFTVANPDCLTTGVAGTGNTPFRICPIDVTQFPSGVSIVYFEGRVTSGNTTYVFNFEKWSLGSYASQLAYFTANNTKGTQSGCTVVEADREIFLNLPATGAYLISGSIRFFRR